jgi:hypothetical protein
MRNLRGQICAGLLLVAIINPALAQAQPGPQAAASETALVTPDNFNRAETDMYFGGLTGCDYGHSAGWPGAVRSAQLGSGKPEEGARGASGVG